MGCRSKYEPVKILEEIIGHYLHDLRVGKDFLNETQNMLTKMEKNDH